MIQRKNARFIFIVVLISILMVMGTNQVFAYGGDGSGTGPNESQTPPAGYTPPTKNFEERIRDEVKRDEYEYDTPGTESVGTGDSQRSTEDTIAIDQEARNNAPPTDIAPVTYREERIASNEFLAGLTEEERQYFQSLGATPAQILEAQNIRRYYQNTPNIKDPAVRRTYNEMINNMEAGLLQDIKNTHLNNEQRRQAAIQRLQRYQDFCTGMSLNIVTAPMGGIGIGINIGINALAGGVRGAGTSSAAALVGQLAGPAPNLIAGAMASSVSQETFEMALDAGENK